jgi:hypothetical protein
LSDRANVSIEVPPMPPQCIIEQTYVRPQIDRLSRDVTAAHSQLRDHAGAIERLLLWRDESARRMALLEQSAVEQREASRRGEAADAEMRTEFAALRDHTNNEFEHIKSRLATIGNGQEALLHRFDLYAEDTKKSYLLATKRHEQLMRNGMSLAWSVGGLVAVLFAMHGALSGVPMIETIRGLIPK